MFSKTEIKTGTNVEEQKQGPHKTGKAMETNETGDVFKTRRSLLRSPPNNNRTSSWSGDKELERSTEKTGEIGTGDGTRKRPRHNTPEEEQNAIEKEGTKARTPLDRMNFYKEEVRKAISREVNSKISFTKSDQAKVRESLDNMTTEAAEIIIKAEKERIEKEALERNVNIRRRELEEIKELCRGQTRIIQQLVNEMRQMKDEQIKGTEEIKALKELISEGIERATQEMDEEGRTTYRDEREHEERSRGTRRGREYRGEQEKEAEQQEEIERTNQTREQRTYAQITKKRGETRMEPQVWKSPEKEERWETIVRRKRGTETEEGEKQNIKEIKKCLLQARIQDH